MAEPTSSGSAAVAAGLGAFIVAAIGVEVQPLFWSLIGAVLGLSLAASAGRVRAVAVFVAVVFASALLGSWAAHETGAGAFGRNAMSLLVATLFHPLLSAAIAQVPQLVAALGDRFAAFFGRRP